MSHEDLPWAFVGDDSGAWFFGRARVMPRGPLWVFEAVTVAPFMSGGPGETASSAHTGLEIDASFDRAYTITVIGPIDVAIWHPNSVCLATPRAVEVTQATLARLAKKRSS